MTEYTNMIFDYGNVLAVYDPPSIARHFVGEAEADAFAGVFFDRVYWDAMDLGQIREEAFLSAVSVHLPQYGRDLLQRVLREWYRVLPVMPGMPALTEALRGQGKHLYLLSNISVGFAAHAREMPMLDKFDGLVMSGPLGIAKPSRAIYRYLLDTYALRAQDCLFIDDREENLFGAAEEGIAGYHFDGNTAALAQALGFSSFLERDPA